jgi:hypothetical protein
MAERVRFELTRACAPAVFKTAAINHSATAPPGSIARGQGASLSEPSRAATDAVARRTAGPRTDHQVAYRASITKVSAILSCQPWWRSSNRIQT